MTTTSVYFILQLDSIRTGIISLFVCLGILVALIKLFVFLAWADSTTGSANEKAWAKKMETSPKYSTLAWMIAGIFISVAFIPDTKTAAASVIAPQIANSSIAQRDIPELYTLAIGKLKSALGAETPKPEAPK